jgi:hypothetical protein
MYYYLRSTLPTLMPASGAPFSYEGFLARCEGRVDSADYELLMATRAQAPEDDATAKAARRSPILASYRIWDKALRNELVRLRAHKLGKAPERFIRPGDPEWDAVRVAQAAIQCEDPLEGELLIDREKWSFVERLETNHLFDLEALVAYALKLQILERRALFEAERGETSYKTAYREILDAAEAPASDSREA